MTFLKVSYRGGAIVLAAALSLAASAQTAAPVKKTSPAKKTPPPAKLTLDPKAVAILKATSDKLASAKTLSFTAVELYERLSRQNMPLAYGNKYEVTLQRPDKLRVIRTADSQEAEFYLDGKSMIAFVPGQNLIAKTDAPSTLDAALEEAYKKAAIYLPFDDFIVANPYGDLAPHLRHAYYIGQSNVVGGVTTDMIAYADDSVFAQIWIGAEDKLPRLVRAVFLDDPEQLRHELAFTNWKLDEPVADGTFAPANAAGAKLIPFARPESKLPPNAKPPAKARPATKTNPPKAQQ